MPRIHSISDLPNRPAVYALIAGRGASAHVAYVGIAQKLKARIRQHLVRRNSSVTTGTSAVSLNPDYVTVVRWWEHPDFETKAGQEAAEIVAFEVLEPVLRSRGKHSKAAKRLAKRRALEHELRDLFKGEPAGELRVSNSSDVLARLDQLERRVRDLEARAD